ncbi:MAG TPA: hypothetical protein VJP45_07990 [Candidatus Limnocylindria bacterium]|nr:hypothetical protein [Candidatus Limnocylindria bacterium]
MSDDTLAWLADKVRMFLSFYPAAQAFETYVAAVTRVLAGRPDIEQERWEAGYETRANEERLGYHCAPAAAQPPAEDPCPRCGRSECWDGPACDRWPAWKRNAADQAIVTPKEQRGAEPVGMHARHIAPLRARIAELEALLTRCEPRLVSDLRIAEYAEDSATADALRLLLADIARSTDP